MSLKKQTRLITLSLAIIGLLPLAASAQTSSSDNYRVEEAQFGSGGEVESCSSGQFCAQSSLGSLGVGSASSDNFDLEAGFLTSGEPFLEFVVSNQTIDLGTLSSSTVSSGSGLFYVQTYLSGAYSVVTLSDPPTSEGGAQLDAMTTTGVSALGTEQFGINVVDNSNPNIGTNPVNIPDNNFADGTAAPGYDIANQFRYVKGETIAEAAATAGNQAVGRTEYTISYIANISGITEAGAYTMGHDLMVVATY